MKYLLIVFLHHPTPALVVGPFDNLLACERASSQVMTVRHSMGYGRSATGTVCVSLKSPDFKYKEPEK